MWQRCPSSVEMCIWAPFPHSLVTGNKIGLEKLSLFDMQNLGLLVNTLAVDDNYPVPNRDNLTIPIQMQLYQKKKPFLNVLLHFWNLAEILNVSEKRVTLISFVFPILWTPKTWLDKCLKSPVLEELSARNMKVVPKRSLNLHHGKFIIFIDHYQVNSNGKGLFYLHAKSWECLLTHWLPMKSILLLIETIYDTNSDEIISGTKNFFSIFYCIFKF